jgi:hypothetical protein
MGGFTCSFHSIRARFVLLACHHGEDALAELAFGVMQTDVPRLAVSAPFDAHLLPYQPKANNFLESSADGIAEKGGDDRL